MVKKCIGFLLILLVPMQAMAALTMDLQLQGSHPATVSVSNGTADPLNNHPCHQEVAAALPDESTPSTALEQGGCHSCTLCMAFGLTPASLLLVTADHLSQSVLHLTKVLISAELIRSSKPPIL